MNPFDEIAVEEAIRLKEAGKAEEVIAVSIGVKQRRRLCVPLWPWGRTARSSSSPPMTSTRISSPCASPNLLKAVVDEEQPGLVLAGKQAIDNDMNATGQMLAALLGWSQGTFASELDDRRRQRRRHPRS